MSDPISRAIAPSPSSNPANSSGPPAAPEALDHRALGAELDLYSINPQVGAGMVLWHPRGAAIRGAIEDFERSLLLKHGYDLVYSPHIVNEALFERSGHLAHFSQSMFGPIDVDGVAYRPKPMNCPGHMCIYESRPRSYRDLPIRYAEFGAVYRYELSGALHGLLSVRGFVQDDAHIFCRPDQAEEEIGRLLGLVDEMLGAFGYPYEIELSSRPSDALGSEAQWSEAEAMLARALVSRDKPYRVDAGGGAFYGPKLDFKLIDALGRHWQGPTVQLDFNLPERFDLSYVGADNARHRPVMLHRALVGSLERFVAGLVEHYAGAFPLWLAPEQLHVLPVQEAQRDAGAALVESCRAAGLRAVLSSDGDLRNRIRNAERLKVPYMAILGKREVASGQVAVRARGALDKQQMKPVSSFIEELVRMHRERQAVP